MNYLPKPRVSIVGSGQTAASLADALHHLPVRVTTVEPSDAARVSGDLVIVATGSSPANEDNLLTAAARNTPSVAWVVRRLDEVLPEAIVLIASPPVALTTRLAIDLSTRHPARILGIPPVVAEAAQFGRTALAAHPLQIPVADVAALVASIVQDDGAVHLVCTPAPRAYGVGNVVLSLPCTVGREGIRERLVVSRNPEEQLGLAVAAATLRAAYDALVGGAAVG
jgi:malate/lactate dehydrogenase